MIDDTGIPVTPITQPWMRVWRIWRLGTVPRLAGIIERHRREISPRRLPVILADLDDTSVQVVIIPREEFEDHFGPVEDVPDD